MSTTDSNCKTANSRIDAEQTTPEASPSAGWRETAALMHVTAGLEECDVLGCHRENDPVLITEGFADVAEVGP